MSDQRADAGLHAKKDSQVDRVSRAIEGALPDQMKHLGPLLARAAIAAHPDPYIKKERNRPKLPSDDCVLCATRGEFVALVEFIEAHPKTSITDNVPTALCRALREQGVV